MYEADIDVSIFSTTGKNLIAPFILVSPYILMFVTAPGFDPEIVKLPLSKVFPNNVLFPI